MQTSKQDRIVRGSAPNYAICTTELLYLHSFTNFPVLIKLIKCLGKFTKDPFFAKPCPRKSGVPSCVRLTCWIAIRQIGFARLTWFKSLPANRRFVTTRKTFCKDSSSRIARCEVVSDCSEIKLCAGIHHKKNRRVSGIPCA